MKVLGFAGSPRRGGNSETLLDAALDGAANDATDVQKIVLNELSFRPCQNCGYCSRKGVCRFDDDMGLVYDALDKADRIVLASPIFFATVSAQTKMMIDRCQPYWARKFLLERPSPKGRRKGLFLAVGGFERGRKFFQCARQVARVWLFNLDISLDESLFYAGVDDYGAIREHPTALDDARTAGRALVER